LFFAFLSLLFKPVCWTVGLELAAHFEVCNDFHNGFPFCQVASCSALDS
jgi:hypothetical protein